jgi:hypothetical protein
MPTTTKDLEAEAPAVRTADAEAAAASALRRLDMAASSFERSRRAVTWNAAEALTAGEQAVRIRAHEIATKALIDAAVARAVAKADIASAKPKKDAA